MAKKVIERDALEVMAMVSKTDMDSLEIAEITGRLHKRVLEDIRILEESLEGFSVNGAGTVFRLVEYKDSKGEMRPMYDLDADTTLTLFTDYYPKVRFALIKRWKQLEAMTPMSFIEAMQLATQKLIENEQLKIERDTAIKQKGEISNSREASVMGKYSGAVRKITKLEGIIEEYKTQYFTPTELGKLIGVSGIAMNTILSDAGLQYKMNKKWIITEEDYHIVVMTEVDTPTFKTTKEQVKWSTTVLSVLDIDLEEV